MRHHRGAPPSGSGAGVVTGVPQFGRSFTIGVEEELLLVDAADGYRLADVAREVLAGMPDANGGAGHEAYSAEIELRSPVARDAVEAVASLAAQRRAARAAGAVLLGAGIHPTAELGDVLLVDEPRYRRVEDDMRGLIRRTPECALHVHVGMPDADTAIRAFNGLRAWMPLLQALSANSPWWFGHDSGLASARYALTRSYPGRGVPQAFEDWDDYAAAVEAAVRAGGSEDYTHLWWDVRPHPQLGTVEVREMDAQAGLDDVAALAALVHGLARREAERRRRTPPAEAINWSVFRAARDGLDAGVLDGDGDVRPAREVARAAVAAVRHLTDSDALDGIERIVREGGGAAWQRRVAAQRGPDGLLRALVERTSP